MTDEELAPAWVLAGLERHPAEPFEPLVPEVPDWVLDAPPSVEEPGCDCGCSLLPSPDEFAIREDEPVRWAVPGLWGPSDQPVVPVVGELVERLTEVVALLDDVDPLALTDGQALGEAEALLAASTQLRVQLLGRTEDVCARKAYEHTGFRSAVAWVRTVAPDVPSSDRTLARRLPGLPFLRAAVREGRVSLAGAGKTAAALGKVRRFLDRPDGLVDGLDGEEVVAGIAENVVDVICKHHFGLASDDPAEAALLARLEGEVGEALADGGSQQSRVERLLVVLTAHLPVPSLGAALEDIVLAIVPSLLEDQERGAQDKRGLACTRNADGTWEISGTLTPECGERWHAALAAEARRDPANPVDTALREQHREAQAEAEGRDRVFDPDPVEDWERPGLLEASGTEPELVPRSRSKRLHDALNRLLERCLSQGLGGVCGKVPVQATVTISERTTRGAPGAPPARGATGRPLARSLIRRWWCDTHVTALLMSRGWTPLGVVHSARTITGTELKAARVQFDDRCAGVGCCPGVPDPLIPLVPHHVYDHATHGRTSLGETVLCCPNLHLDLHVGKRTIRLRDGRLLDERGWLPDDDGQPLALGSPGS